MRRTRWGPFLGALLLTEVVVFIVVGGWIGAGWTILAALFTSAIGLWLFGREGLRSLRAVRTAASDGKPPGPTAVDAALVALGGLLVFIPGFVSDLVGLLCLIPLTRPLIRRLVIGGVARKYGPAKVRSRRIDGIQSPQSPRTSGHEVIEGEIVP